MKLPQTVYSALGPVPVKRIKSLIQNSLLGTFRYAPRRVISIAPKVCPETSIQVLGHEIFHMILIDSGLSNQLNRKMEEALCDTFGTWLSAAVREGKVVLK